MRTFIDRQRLRPFVKASGVLLLCVVGSIVQGCATNRPLTLEERVTLSPMHVYRTQTPELVTRSIGGAISDQVLAPGQLVTGMSRDTGRSFRKASENPYPDVGLSILKSFSNYVTSTIPIICATEDPVQTLSRSDGSVVLISVDSLGIGFLGMAYGGGYGLNIVTTLSMYDSFGILRWHEMFFYNTGNFKKNKKNQKEYFENNSIELNNELHFAADITAKQFIDAMNGKRKSMRSPFRPILRKLE